MYVFNLKKYKSVILALILFICVFSFITIKSYGMTHYQETDFVTGLVTASALNVRQGPGTNFKIITQVYKNQYIRVFARIGDWYVIQTDGDILGAVSVKYIKPIYPSSQGNNNQNENTNTVTKSDAEQVLELINAKRTANGLNALVMDTNLQKVAQDKAQDMLDNNYFSHNSPVYGSPFDMMKNYGISYRTAR